MTVEREFLEKNRKYFLETMHNAPKVHARMLAIPQMTFYETFHQVIINKDFRYLSFCLFFIHDGTETFDNKEIKNDEKFALQSLEWLHSNTDDSVISYFLAYALRFDLQLQESEELLWELKEKKFAPAILALGELRLSKGKVEEAIRYFKDAGTFSAWWAHLRLLRTHGSLLHQMLHWFTFPIVYFKKLREFSPKKKIYPEFLNLKFQFDTDYS